jgi:hypothetical protein
MSKGSKSYALVTQACNPKCVGDWDWGDCSSRSDQAKSLQDPFSMVKNWVWYNESVTPAMVDDIKQEDGGQPGKKHDTNSRI